MGKHLGGTIFEALVSLIGIFGIPIWSILGIFILCILAIPVLGICLIILWPFLKIFQLLVKYLGCFGFIIFITGMQFLILYILGKYGLYPYDALKQPDWLN